MHLLRVVLLASLLAGCNTQTGYGASLETPSDIKGDPYTGSVGLGGNLRWKAEVCKDEPLQPEFALLTEQSMVQYLKKQNYQVRTVQARGDLVYIDVAKDGTIVRLRVAILKSAHEAGRELHDAMHEHGPGSWGVHRSNLAVLGPVGSLRQVLAFVADTKLACWGVFTATGRDDNFVIPGGYREI